MIEFTSYQSDVVISNPKTSDKKATLRLSETGDLQLSNGTDKLTPQLIRALINDDSPLKDLINSKASTGRLYSVVTTILKQFKNTQLDLVNGQDTEMLGFKLYRKAAGTDEEFVEVSHSVIQWKFQDTQLANNTTYTYGVTKIFTNSAESEFIDQVDITPTKSTMNQSIVIGNSSIFIAGDRTVNVYTDFNIFFKRDELLNNILDIDVQQDKNDPRRYNVLVTVENVTGNSVTLSARRLNPSTLEPI